MSKRLTPEQQKSIAQQAISENNISHIAQRHNVSRNTVYAQQQRAKIALDEAFLPSTPDDKVLFYLPVTQERLHMIVIALLMICKASYRDCQLFLWDILDTPISIGNIYNIYARHCKKAKGNNKIQNLSPIMQSSSDELFHRSKPYLSVVDIRSRYCALLVREDKRDSDTWGVNLLDLAEKGFQPKVNVSDQGAGMLKGFELYMSDTEHRADHFHIIKDFKELVRYLKNREKSAVTHQVKLEEKMDKAKQKKSGQALSSRLSKARKVTAQAEELYTRLSTLGSWLQHDILQLSGHNPKDREDLFDFILVELEALSGLAPRVEKVVKSLHNQKDNLLAVTHTLNQEFERLAQHYSIAVQDVWDVCYTTRYDIGSVSYHNKADVLAERLGPLFEKIEDEVLAILAVTPRCSSMVENFHSRLRPYLDPRKQVSSDGLEMIQYYLNHQIFLRSEHDYMRGKSPAEVMTGKPHPHWLDMLGFKRFERLDLAA